MKRTQIFQHWPLRDLDTRIGPSDGYLVRHELIPLSWDTILKYAALRLGIFMAVDNETIRPGRRTWLTSIQCSLGKLEQILATDEDAVGLWSVLYLTGTTWAQEIVSCLMHEGDLEAVNKRHTTFRVPFIELDLPESIKKTKNVGKMNRFLIAKRQSILYNFTMGSNSAVSALPSYV